ncbi:FlgN protein [Caloranaerobacter azorensis DSM 13643]|uniref:FlgN protein n=1 Tax=Caloranaerobacter azorensis DSM 13643 TaxID=1121264 RepID=A0A1M5V3S6_9FIRM|nr:flagellar protein FlgN [Caloranaerobacter azorensis]SHH69919.1 FlgN protein [Caloranaerobacter azorensis DSM 13643]
MEKLINDLKDILIEELNLYKHMLELSINKTDIITSGQVRELDKITQKEQALILKAGKLEDIRESIISKIQDELNLKEVKNISKLVDYLSEDQKKEIEYVKQQLIDVLNRLKERNSLNSTLIKDSLEYINLNVNLLANVLSSNIYSDKVSKDDVVQSKNIFDAKV